MARLSTIQRCSQPVMPHNELRDCTFPRKAAQPLSAFNAKHLAEQPGDGTLQALNIRSLSPGLRSTYNYRQQVPVWRSHVRKDERVKHHAEEVLGHASRAQDTEGVFYQVFPAIYSEVYRRQRSEFELLKLLGKIRLDVAYK
jgi:hypothetical protein